MFRPYYFSELGYVNSVNTIPNNFRINKNKRCLKILTETGMELIIEKDLSLKLLNESGFIEFKKAEDLKVGDICISSFKNFLFPKESLIEKRKAYTIGLLYAFKINEENLILNLPRGDIFNYIGEYFYRYFQVEKENNDYLFYIPYEYIKNNNICKNSIPNFIFEGDKESQIYFLRGFFDMNSIVYENRIIKDIYDNELLQQISLMLRNLGIIAEVDNYDLVISGQEIISFYNIIGTKNLKYEEEILNINLNETDFYEIENLKKICRDFFNTTDKLEIDINAFKFTRTNILKLIEKDGDLKLKNQIHSILSENICFDKIVSIEEIVTDYLVMETCDIDTYIMNGFYIKK